MGLSGKFFGFLLLPLIIFFLSSILTKIFLPFWARFKSPFFKKFGFLILSLVALGAYCTVGFVMHARFKTFMFDLGYRDQILWQMSQLRLPRSSVLPLLRVPRFSYVLYVPCYWLTKDVRVYHFLEALTIVFASFPILLLAKRHLKSVTLALSIAFSFVFFGGIQTALDFPGHTDILLTAFLAWALFFMLEKKWRFFFIAAFLCLLCKENASIYLIFLGSFVMFFLKEVRIGFWTVALGAFWLFFFVSSFISSRFGGYPFFAQYPIFEKGFLQFVKQLFYPLVKLETLIWLFSCFSFLPILSPKILFLSVPMFLERFLSSKEIMWQKVYYWSATSAPVLAVAAIFGVERIFERFKKRFSKKALTLFFSFVFFLSPILITFYTPTPLIRLFLPSFFRLPSYFSYTREAVSLIPSSASVLTQESIFPHLSHRDSIFPLLSGKKADFVILDVNLDFNPYLDVKKFISELLSDDSYGLIYSQGGALIFARGEESKIEPSIEVERFLN